MTAPGTRVRILDPRRIHYLNTGIVTQVTFSGRLQVRDEVDGQLDLYAPEDVREVRS